MFCPDLNNVMVEARVTRYLKFSHVICDYREIKFARWNSWYFNFVIAPVFRL